ncbi:MAG TPA: hypothetical protein VNL92_05150, partial [Dehalococcoidia bacterium]|nr:hypothetical protein [Dehalococcoidia bacterium]
MSSTLRLIDVEVFKLRKRWMTWLLLSVLLVLIVVVYVLLWAVTETLTDTAGGRPIGLFGTTQLSDVRETLFLEQAVPFGLQMTQIVGTFLGVILASGSVGGEYGWDTVRPFLTAVP